jgi:hypothetical protein
MESRMHLPFAAFFLALVAAACATQVTPVSTPTREVAGSCQPAFGAQICSYAEMSGARVVALGATVPMAAIDNTPVDGPMV